MPPSGPPTGLASASPIDWNPSHHRRRNVVFARPRDARNASKTDWQPVRLAIAAAGAPGLGSPRTKRIRYSPNTEDHMRKLTTALAATILLAGLAVGAQAQTWRG